MLKTIVSKEADLLADLSFFLGASIFDSIDSVSSVL